MKNLKKVLALVLAFACAFTMFASAAFTDQADISQTEAVDMLTALGVIQGYTDGSFRPDDTVTRAEAAKMIFTIRNGGNDNASAFESVASSFTDINGHWAAGYIKFCQSMGIIAGKSATRFAPDETVTGSELAKMMLVCLGYDAEKAGLVGYTWEQKTIGLASENGILEDVTAPLSAACPRQYAAQIMYNAIQVPSVTLDDGEYTNWNAQADKHNASIGSKFMNLDIYEGVLLSASNYDAMNSSADADGKVSVAVQYKNGDATTGTSAFKFSGDTTALVGEYVKVLYDNSDKVAYGVYSVEDENFVVESTMGKVDQVAANATKVKVDGTEYDLDVAANEPNTVYGMGNDTTFVAAFNGTKSADKVKFVSNDGDEKIDLAIVVPVEAYKVTYVGPDSITLSALNGAAALGNKKTADCVVTGDLAKDDYVAVVDKAYNADGKYEVSKIDITEGKVTEIKVSGAATTDVKVDGTWYKLLSGLKDDNNDQVAVDSTYKFAIIDGYVYNAELVTGGSTKLAMVTGTTNNTDFDDNVQVRLLLADGTTVTAYASECGATGLGDVDIDELVAYEVDDEIYTLYIPGKDYDSVSTADTAKAMAGYDNVFGIATASDVGKVTGDAFEKSGSAPVTRTIADQKINDNAVVFVKQAKNTTSGDFEYKVLTGAQVNDWNANWGLHGAGLSKNSGLGYLDVAVLIGASNTVTPGSTTNYAYVTSDISKGSDYVAYTIWDGENSIDVTEKVSSTNAVKGEVISFDWDGESTIKNVAVAGKYAAIEYTTGTQVKLNDLGVTTADTYKLADDAVIININTTDKVGIPGNAVTEAQKDAAGDYYVNAKYVLNSDGEIELLVIDVQDNKWDGKGLDD